ncbi:M12 family metallo-peptidase [Kineococcus sp. NPDC059986]|uniref:M12 family metallo-peptidase n=1 Tax=Kineococcus sp. NPDC059986 TaxID=3155538 RepID=UPI00344CBE94
MPVRLPRSLAALPLAALALCLTAAPATAAPAASSVVETGTVVQVATETPVHAGGTDHDGTRTLLRRADGTFTDVGGEAVEHLATGTSVRAEVRDGTATAVSARAAVRTLAAAGGPSTVRVAMVVPAGVTQDAAPATTAQVATAVQQASDYWSSQTAGQVRFQLAGVQGWTTSSRTCSDVGGLWTEAARAAGFTGAPREHLVVLLPRNAYTSRACAAYGLGSVGAGPDSAGYAYVTDTEPSLWAHELGHNLGLGHANLLSSATASDVAWNGSSYPGATRVPYGDVWDVMSFSGATIGHGNLGVAGQYRLGLLRNGIQDVTATGSYTFAALPVAADGAVHGLRAVDPATGTAYFVELRGRSTGDDLVASDASRPTRGVRVTTADRGEDGATLALDASPTGRRGDVDLALAPGATLSTASGRLHVTVTAAGDTKATVTVTFGDTPRPTPAPAPAPAGSASTVAPQGVSFNRDGVNRVVSGPVLQAYLDRGAQRGALGWPTSDALPVRDGGVVQRFEGGLVYWTAGTGAQVVAGAVLGEYASLGWEGSVLGFPTSGEIPVTGGVVQRFQRGLVYSSPTTGAHAVRGAVEGRYAAAGWERSVLGFPTSDEIPVRGGVVQRFSGGNVYWSPAAGAQVVRGAVLGEYGRRGWEGSRLGFPVGEEVPAPGGVRQQFQGGTLTWTAATGRVA